MSQAEMKFLPHTTGMNKLTATYKTVKTHIEQYVQMTYKHGQDTHRAVCTEDIQTRTRYSQVTKGTMEKGPYSGNANEKNVYADK